MKRDSTSTLTIKYSGFSLHISLENSKLFLKVKLVFAMGSMRRAKNFAKLQERFLIADKIDLNGGHLSTTCFYELCTFYQDNHFY